MTSQVCVCVHRSILRSCTLWESKIAMENGPFVDDFNDFSLKKHDGFQCSWVFHGYIDIFQGVL